MLGKLIDEIFKAVFISVLWIGIFVATGGNWIFWMLIAAYVLRPFYDKRCRTSS